MARAIQPVSLLPAQNEGTDISFNCYKAVKEAKTDARDNLQMLASLYETTNNLCSSLDRLDNLMETIIFCKEKGEDVKK